MKYCCRTGTAIVIAAVIVAVIVAIEGAAFAANGKGSLYIMYKRMMDDLSPGDLSPGDLSPAYRGWCCATLLAALALATAACEEVDSPAPCVGDIDCPSSMRCSAAADANTNAGDGCPTTEPVDILAWRSHKGDAPAPRSHHAMACDAAGGRAVLFAGHDGDSPLDDTWQWDGQAWRRAACDGPCPPARFGHAMAYDAARKRVVLFAGRGPDFAEFSDTWEWDGSMWHEMEPAGEVPKARAGHAMAYDGARGRVVLFGGQWGIARELDDLWEWDGHAWHRMELTGSTPSARSGHAMAYDAAAGFVVLFGGFGGKNLDDTWTWDGQTWQREETGGRAPAARYGHAMAYDGARERTVLFGGFVKGGRGDDTWEWNGMTWSPLELADEVPLAREEHAMCYDGARGQVVLFGGYDGAHLDDTWHMGY